MKKLLSASVLAICLIALSQQQASAWVNSKFFLGMTWDYQSGNTSTLWGLWRNGQVPGPEAFGGGPAANPYYRNFSPAGPAFPYPFTGQPMPAPAAGGFPGFPGQTMQPPLGFQPPFVDPSNISNLNQASPFQLANFPRPVEYYYFPSR